MHSHAAIKNQLSKIAVDQVSQPKIQTSTETKETIAGSKEQKFTSELAKLGSSVSFEIPYEELTFHSEIGSGSTASVYKGEWRGYDVAIKELFITLEDGVEACFETEREILKKLQIKGISNVIAYGGYAMSPPSKKGYSTKGYIVMEYASKGNVSYLVEQHRKEEKQIPPPYKVLTDIAAGLADLHDMHIVHHDPKLENTLMTSSGEIKLADFGDSVQLDPDQTSTQTQNFCGSRGYTSPESTRNICSYKTDVYAFGTITYILGTHIRPFFGETSKEEHSAITAGKRASIPKECPVELTKLINWCWQQNPEERPTMKQVHQYLQEVTKTMELESITQRHTP